MSELALRYEFDRRPPEPERLLMCEWLRRHGIDPGHVNVPGWIERQPQLYRVAWLDLARDENGKPRLVTGEDGYRDVVPEVRFVQLEGPPLPFPQR